MKEDASIKDESKRFAGRPKVEITAESIRKFFRLVNQRNYEKATKLGLEILTNAGKDELSESSAVEEAEKSMTLFASSFTSLLSDPSFNLSEVGLRAFLVNKSSLRRAFLGTSFKDMSHLFGLMGSGSDGQSVISEKDWWRLMIAMSALVVSVKRLINRTFFSPKRRYQTTVPRSKHAISHQTYEVTRA